MNNIRLGFLVTALGALTALGQYSGGGGTTPTSTNVTAAVSNAVEVASNAVDLAEGAADIASNAYEVATNAYEVATNAVRRAGDTMSGPITNVYGFFGNGAGLTGVVATAVERDPVFTNFLAYGTTTNILVGRGATVAPGGVAGAIVIGAGSTGTTRSVTLGHSSAVVASDGISIGQSAFAYRGLSLGAYSAARGTDRDEQIAIGYVAVAENGGLAIGGRAYAEALPSLALGNIATSKTAGVAIGQQAYNYFGGVSIGNLASNSFYGVAIGNQAMAGSAGGNVAIGGGDPGFGAGSIRPAIVPVSFVNTTEIGGGTAISNGWLHYRGNPVIDSNGAVFARGPGLFGNAINITNIPIYVSSGGTVTQTSTGAIVSIMGATPTTATQVVVADGPNIDAFDRLRVSQPYTLFDSKQIHRNDTNIIWSQVGSNAVFTYVRTNAAVEMQVDTNGEWAIRQTKQRFNYQPGKGQEILITFVASTNSGVYQRIGYFNANTTVNPYDTAIDGIYLIISNGAASIAVSKSGTHTIIPQASWNLDKMNGTGTSGINLNFSKAQIFFIDFEWLGVGRVRTGFVVDGIITYAHEFLHANNVGSVYMSNPNHSIRYEIRSTGGTGTLSHICSAVLSEGGAEQSGNVFAQHATNAPTIVTGDQRVSLMALRIATNDLCANVLVEQISLFSTSLGAGEALRWELVLNPSYGTPLVWNPFDGVSIIEWASSPNVATTGGTVIASGFLTGTADETVAIPRMLFMPGCTVDGVRDELILRATSIGANNDPIYSIITWHEY